MTLAWVCAIVNLMIEAWRKSLARTAPGSGVNQPDDGAGPSVKVKSIPQISTPRLERAVEFHHGALHTQEGLHANDSGRRSLIENGMRVRAMTHELRMRGVPDGDCAHCWGQIGSHSQTPKE